MDVMDVWTFWTFMTFSEPGCSGSFRRTCSWDAYEMRPDVPTEHVRLMRPMGLSEETSHNVKTSETS